MADYVYTGQNIFHVPARIDPAGDPEKTTPGAIFAPGVPTPLDDRDAQNPHVQEMIKRGQLRPAEAADTQKAAQVEEERKRENEEAAKKLAAATGKQPAGKQ